MNDSGTAIYKVTFHFSLHGEPFASTQEGIDEYLQAEIPSIFESYIPSDHMKFYRPNSVVTEVLSIEYDNKGSTDE